MADENTLNTEAQGQQAKVEDKQEPEVQEKVYKQSELEALLKEAETKGFVKGKNDTNARWEKKNAEAIKLAKEEAEKQSRFEKMSELEKAQAKAKENEEELLKLKKEIALNEQKNETRKLLKEKDLPDCFLNAVLVFGDAEATSANVDEFKVIWEAEIQKRVESKISTHIPKQNVVPPSATGNVNEADARRILGLKAK